MCSKPTVRYQMADGQIGKLACKIKTVFFQRRYSIPDWSLNKKWVYINHLVIKQRNREPGWTNEVVLQWFPSGSINSSSSIASMCCLQTAAITTTRSKIGVIFFSHKATMDNMVDNTNIKTRFSAGNATIRTLCNL